MNEAEGRTLLPRRVRDQRGVTLVELLIGMIVMGILSTMLLLTWFSLNNSYSYSVRSYEARDNARVAVSRVQREIRDAQSPAQNTPAVVIAQPDWVAFYSTFNEALNSNPLLAPHLVVYRLYTDGTLWRYEDGHNGTAGVQGISSVNNPMSLLLAQALSEQANGEGATMILRDMVNATAKTPAVPLFQYTSVGSDGTIHIDPSVTGVSALRTILGVQLRTLVDLNPGKAPIYLDFMTLAQLRNQRPF